MMWMIGILIIVVLSGLFYASYNIRTGIYVKAFCKGVPDRKVVALTFDDGPNADQTPMVLDLLKKQGVPATFFCIGKQGAANPDILRRMVAEGHLVGNHSWGHRAFFPLFSKRKMRRELQQTRQLLEEVTGQAVDLFRPPFGVTNPTVAAVAKQLGMRVIGWTIRSFDTRGESVEVVFRRVKRQICPGAIVLLHDRLPQSGELLEIILQYLKAEGYQVVRIDEML